MSSQGQTQPRQLTLLLTVLAVLAFAANSLLCRYALLHTHTAPGAFLAVRILAGALALICILYLRRTGSADAVGKVNRLGGDWYSALALFAYGAGFSFAYLSLSAATGALLLFGAVQLTMIGSGLLRGERLQGLRLLGFTLASAGLVLFLLPGFERPPLLGSALMLLAGMAWGVYSLRGRGAADPLAVTAGNFMRAALPALLIGLTSLPIWPYFPAARPSGYAQAPFLDSSGLLLALLSGAVSSGLGYVIWYSALRGLRASEAATVQLSVPLLAAAGGALLLGEPLSQRFALCTAAILGGIALVVSRK